MTDTDQDAVHVPIPTPTGGFDPRAYLSKVGGNDYLQVMWRLLWLRTEHPDAAIETHDIELTDKRAVFRAEVAIPNGGSATGYGSETEGDFHDYIEKAETKAIGRALAALGFGTQFTGDELHEGPRPRIVDSPVKQGAYQPNNPNAPGFKPMQRFNLQGDGAARPAMQHPSAEATDKQIGFLMNLAGRCGLTEEEIEDEFNVRFEGMTRQDASRVIGGLQERLASARRP